MNATIKNRERRRKQLLDPKYQEYNRKKSKEYYHKRKNDPDFIDRERKRHKLARNKEKYIVLLHYSNNTKVPTCQCCGEIIIQFLEIDHENNDGAEHRKTLGYDRIYHWLIKNNFPEGFKTMCANCNKGRFINGGICPHE